MELKVAFLNCRSHGDCAVITFEEKGKPACIVVDGGDDRKSAGALADYLHSQHIRNIDLMVGTHIDQDHINGLKYFVQGQLEKKKRNKPYIIVKAFWGPMPSEEYVPDILPASARPSAAISMQRYIVQSVQQNDDLYDALLELGADISHPALDNKPKALFKDIKMELIGPDTQIPADHIVKKALGRSSPLEDEGPITTLEELENAVSGRVRQMAEGARRDANNQSIVFRLFPACGAASARGWKFLFPGDAEEEAWDEMCKNVGLARKLRARVLKIPHHGSAENGITKSGAKKVKPRYSVVSVGQKHGLPDEEILKLLHGSGSKILCTQRNQSSSHKSACYYVRASDCPAKSRSADVVFSLDTTTGKCDITPVNRECMHVW